MTLNITTREGSTEVRGACSSTPPGVAVLPPLILPSQRAFHLPRAQLLRDTGYQHFRKGQYQEALACYTGALKAAQARSPNNPRIIA
jgi:hypothetical protein